MKFLFYVGVYFLFACFCFIFFFLFFFLSDSYFLQLQLTVKTHGNCAHTHTSRKTHTCFQPVPFSAVCFNMSSTMQGGKTKSFLSSQLVFQATFVNASFSTNNQRMTGLTLMAVAYSSPFVMNT